MIWIKKLLKKYLSTLAFFYRFLKYRILIIMLSSFLVALLDGIGLTMFIPLLQSTAMEGMADKEQMGQMVVVVDILESFGLTLNLNVVLLIMACVFILKGAMRYWEGFYRTKVRMIFMKTIRYQMIDGLSNMRFSHFINSDAGRIQNGMTTEVNRVISSFENYFKTIQGIVMISIYVFLAVMANPQFAVLVVIIGLLSNFLYQRLYKITKKLSHKYSNAGHGFQGFLIQGVHHFKYLKATNGIFSYKGKIKRKILQMEKASLKMGQLGALLIGTREAVTISLVIFVIYIQVHFLHGTIGAILLSLMFFYRSLALVMVVQTNWNSFLITIGALDTVNGFLKELEEEEEREGGEDFVPPFEEIRLKQLGFSYSSTANVLKSIDLEIKQGESVAFVGESGSGKTTLVNIIAGLLENYEGEFTVNGIEVKNLNRNSWRDHIGYITQEPVIFDDTVSNNITFWDEMNAENKERLDSALKKAAIYDFVQSLDKKEEAPLGSNGIMVSGGQKQRISIARELYKDVSVLIMDEATSALDSETEKSIQENVDALKGEYTMLIVAHRLSTIKNVDKIVLLNHGVIEGQGTFTELVNRSERFKKMVELQQF